MKPVAMDIERLVIHMQRNQRVDVHSGVGGRIKRLGYSTLEAGAYEVQLIQRQDVSGTIGLYTIKKSGAQWSVMYCGKSHRADTVGIAVEELHSDLGI
jgi:hypothetical protein